MEISKGRIGFKYTFECFDAQGRLKWEFTEHNLIPDEGRDYILNAALLAGSQFSSWYIGLYEGAHTPAVDDDMAGFPATATEITTAYSEATRGLIVPDALAAGVYVNSAAPNTFTFTAAKTVRGGFISSGSVKGGTTGVLLSAVLASSPKVVAAGESLRVTAGLSLVTV
ncbi:MAG: hypothetical protein AB7E55_23095 [Pigmentiphaga sp.]